MTKSELNLLKSGNTLYYYGNLNSSFTKRNSYTIQGFSGDRTKILINNIWVDSKDIIGNFGLVPEGTKIIPIPEGYKVKNYNDKEIVLDKGSVGYEQIATLGISKGEANYLTVLCSTRGYNKLSAISKLMVVADYLNDGWTPDWNNDKEEKYTITIDRTFYHSGELSIENYSKSIFGVVYFKTYEAAQEAIKILGEEVIRKVLQ